MKTNPIKTVLTTCVFAALTWLGTGSADARPGCSPRPSGRVYVSGHCHCGLPIYTERYFIGYDCQGRPVWGYRQVRHHTHHTIRPSHRHPIQPRPYPYPAGHGVGVSIHGVIR